MDKYRISDLVNATGMSERAIRFYVQRKLLSPATHHGRGRNYTEEHLVRLRAIRRLRAERLNVKEMRARFARMSADELAALGAAPPAPKAPSEAPGKGTLPGGPAFPSPGQSFSPGQSISPGQSLSPGPSSVEHWHRVALLPGLELHVRADAAPFVLRTAAEIRERYSSAPVSPSP